MDIQWSSFPTWSDMKGRGRLKTLRCPKVSLWTSSLGIWAQEFWVQQESPWRGVTVVFISCESNLSKYVPASESLQLGLKNQLTHRGGGWCRVSRSETTRSTAAHWAEVGGGGGAKAGGTRALMKEKAVPTLSCLTSLSPPPAPTAPVRTRFPPRLLLRLHWLTLPTSSWPSSLVGQFKLACLFLLTCDRKQCDPQSSYQRSLLMQTVVSRVNHQNVEVKKWPRNTSFFTGLWCW